MASLVPERDGVLITGVYGAGKSTVAAEIAYLLEKRGEPYALLDLDYLSWAGTGTEDRAAEFGMMLRNLAAVGSNYRDAGIRFFVLAYFIRDLPEADGIRDALRVPLRVVRLDSPMAVIEQRAGTDVSSGRREELRAAAPAIAASEGVGLEDLLVRNDRPVGVIAHTVLAWLGWP